MPITQADIVKIERDWGLEIDQQPDGSYTITTDPTHKFGKISTALDTQYTMNVQPLNEDITINPAYAKALGVDLTGNLATDFANMNRSSFQDAPEAADFHSNYPEFSGSHLHRAACVGAWIRSNGEIPPQSWHANPAFGASGAGASIETGGGQGGAVSTIGPAHDTDMTLGAAAGIGPMRSLTDVVSATGELNSGMHGISNVADYLGRPFSQSEYQVYLNERNSFPDLKNIPTYDNPTTSGPGWNIERIKHNHFDITKMSAETENISNSMGNPLANAGVNNANEATFGGQTGEPVAMLGGIGAQIGEVVGGIGEALGEARTQEGEGLGEILGGGIRNVLPNNGTETPVIDGQDHGIGGPPRDSSASYELSIDDAKLLLAQAREALNASGVESPLRDALNHPGADEMLETLKANGLDPITVHGEEGLSPVDRIQSVLEAGHDTTIENGLEMPKVVPEAQVPNADVIQEFGAADDDHDYGLA